MKLRALTHKQDKTGLFMRLGIVLGVVAIIIGSIQLLYRMTLPQISYSIKEAKCTPAAISERNKSMHTVRNNCVLVLNATNLQNKSVSVDYEGIGGGPLGGTDPLIRINSKNGKFCYALPANASTYPSFAPNATVELNLQCGGVQNEPTNYDTTSDIDPVSIAITGYPTTTIAVNPIR